MNDNISFRPLSREEISGVFLEIYREVNGDDLPLDQFRWKYLDRL